VLCRHHSGDLTEVFTPDKVVPRDVLESWMDDSFTEDNLIQIILDFFNPFWEFPKLNESQINAIRSIIHPEIILPTSNNVQKQQVDVSSDSNTYDEPNPKVNKPEKPTKPVTPKPPENLEPIDLKVLDLRQENNARKIGEGHRIVYGVAGSGKTVLLIAKARILSAQNPDAQILLLC
jgi:hypothetical protein